MDDHDEGASWEQQMDNEARHWWEDEQAMAKHRELHEQFRRECEEFTRESNEFFDRINAA